MIIQQLLDEIHDLRLAGKFSSFSLEKITIIINDKLFSKQQIGVK